MEFADLIRMKSLFENDSKALSSLGETSGGALVAPSEQEEEVVDKRKIKSLRAKYKMLLPNSSAKCMEGPNKGKRGPCPDPNKQRKAKGGSGGGSSSPAPGSNPNMASKIVAQHRASEERMTSFLGDEYHDSRNSYHEATRAFREGRISPDEYQKSVQQYENARTKYVTRLGMPGLKKVAIALGVVAAGAAAGYAGYKYGGVVKDIWKKLDGALNSAGAEKKAAVYITTALGGIKVAGEALKGNSTIDSTTSVASRVTEILLTPDKEKPDELLLSSMIDIQRHGNRAAPESIEYVYKKRAQVRDDIRSGKIDEETLRNAIDQVDRTILPDDLKLEMDDEAKMQEEWQGTFGDLAPVPLEQTREFKKNQKVPGAEEWGYREAIKLPWEYRRQEIANREEAEPGWFANRVMEEIEKYGKPVSEAHEEYMAIIAKPAAERTPEELAKMQKFPNRLRHEIRTGRVDKSVLTYALMEISQSGDGNMDFDHFYDYMNKGKLP